MLSRVSNAMLIAGLLSVSFLTAGRSAAADAEGERIMKEAEAVYTKMQTLSADFAIHQETSQPGAEAMEMHGTFKAQKPDLYAIESDGVLSARMNSDGKTVLFYLKPQNAYAQFPAGGQSMNRTVTAVAPLTLFFNPRKLVAPNTPTFSMGRERWNGKDYDCVEQRLGPTVMRFYIGADRIIPRIKVHLEAAGQKQDVEATLSNVHLNPPLSPADFPTAPPTGAQLFEMPLPGAATLQPGQQAPDFTLPQPTTGEISLTDMLKDRKALLVTFWFYACAACREENPRLQKFYAEWKDKGVGVVAVNSFDDRATINRYMKQTGLSFPVCMDDDAAHHYGIAQKYGVGVYPTSYLLDKTGKIVLRTVGFNEPELRVALQDIVGEPKITRIDPPELGFFSKQLDYEGLPIKAHAVVADAALFKARDWMQRELQHLPDAAYNMKMAGVEFHIIGKDQQTSDLPEHRALKGKPFDGNLTVDQRTRGLGGLYASCGEENLLKLTPDRYRDRDICPHEFAHTLMNYGLTEKIRAQIRQQRERSLAAGKWVKGYAGSNADEYFAELTMWYFGGHGDMTMTGEKPAPGPEGLKKYDPEAYALLDDIYSGRIKVERVSVEPLTAQSAESEKTLRSGNSTVRTTIRFSNKTDQELHVFWLDSDGKRHPYGTVAPHGRSAQNTFATHVWVVADAAGKALAVFTATEKQGLAVVSSSP